MAYLHAGEGDPVSPDLLISLGAALGLTIPTEDLEQLGSALRDQLASARQLAELPLDDIALPVQFDARRHD